MTTELTPLGYKITKEKLAQMEARLAALQKRTDLNPIHKAEAEHSYRDMMRQYLRSIKLYEAKHKIEESESTAPPAGKVT